MRNKPVICAGVDRECWTTGRLDAAAGNARYNSSTQQDTQFWFFR